MKIKELIEKAKAKIQKEWKEEYIETALAAFDTLEALADELNVDEVEL